MSWYVKLSIMIHFFKHCQLHTDKLRDWADRGHASFLFFSLVGGSINMANKGTNIHRDRQTERGKTEDPLISRR